MLTKLCSLQSGALGEQLAVIMLNMLDYAAYISPVGFPVHDLMVVIAD